MRVVIDIEANRLVNPDKIWVIVCKDIDSGLVHIFRNVTDDERQLQLFRRFVSGDIQWIGHNILGYDWAVLDALCGIRLPNSFPEVVDTLVVSRLVNYSRPGGHSIEQYGEDFGLEKINVGKPVAGHNPFFDKYSKEMEEYCVRDVEICERIYAKYLRVITDVAWRPALQLEHAFQRVVTDLHDRGFAFNAARAQVLLDKVTSELAVIDKEILDAYPPRLRLVREIEPKLTKYGTLNRTDFRWYASDDLSDFNGGPFCRCSWQEFNPASHKQVIEVLNSAGWSPTDKTTTHIETEREVNHQRYLRKEERTIDINELSDKLDQLQRTGWKINETNLATLPDKAPKSARLLAKRILLESRRRTLTEWLGLVQPDGRIHGEFYGIGAWTHRMAHQKPNTANIPNEYDLSGKKKLLGKEMRGLWCAPRNRLLVGVDAEGIQLRIFAHYIDDKEFTNALVTGDKDNGTDPHSLNQRILGDICKTRDAAKRFIFALLLGGGIGKLAEILGASKDETQDALNRLMERYQGFTYLKKHIIPSDGRRGWFVGLDGRRVPIPGDTASERTHLCMSGYLQNGEAIVMKSATLKWEGKLKESYNSWLVDLVHDEWQAETPNDMRIALQVAELMANSLKVVGEELGLKCPLAGSYWNAKAKDYTIGSNWAVTH